MAARQQGKRKVRDAKRKKIQKKHQPAKRKQKKQQPRKQKKHQAHPKRRVKQASAPKSADSGTEKISPPGRFASKVLRQMPKVRMEAKARSLMKTLLTDVYDHVATEVENLSQKNELSDISETDVQAALKEAMTKELAKHSPEHTGTECA